LWQIAGDIAEKLRSKLSTSERRNVTKQGTQNPEAYELYLKGLYYWNKLTFSDITTAISYFNQAISKDTGYALAYSGLADAYADLPTLGGTPSEYFPNGNAAARRTLELRAIVGPSPCCLGQQRDGVRLGLRRRRGGSGSRLTATVTPQQSTVTR